MAECAVCCCSLIPLNASHIVLLLKQSRIPLFSRHTYFASHLVTLALTLPRPWCPSVQGQAQFLPVGWDVLTPVCPLPLSRLVLLAAALCMEGTEPPALAHLQAVPMLPWQSLHPPSEGTSQREEMGSRGFACLKAPIAPPGGTGDSTGTVSGPRLSQVEPSSFLTQTIRSQGLMCFPQPAGLHGCTAPP